MFVCVSVYLGYLLERAYHTHRDRQPHYHDGIVQIRKRFLCSETPFNWLMAHQVFVNMHWGPMPVLCVGLSLWSGRVNNADRHLSGAKGARRPTLKCPNSSCQWLWQGESGAVRCSVSAQLVSPSQVRQVCVSKRTLARLRWPACVYVSGRRHLICAAIGQSHLCLWLIWERGDTGVYAFSDQINGTRLTGFTPRNKEPFLWGRNVLWTWGACSNLLHLFTSTCTSTEPIAAPAKTYGGLLCSCQDPSFRFLDKSEEDVIDAGIKKNANTIVVGISTILKRSHE